MKVRTLLFILLSTSFSFILQAQSLSHQVMASGGTSTSNGGYSIAYTIGESVTTTISAGNNILTQGFHQPDLEMIVKLLAKVYLEGPYNGAGMNTILQSMPPVFPNVQPYNGAPWNYNGGENLVSVPANAVDWLLIELRDNAFNPVPGGKRAAVLLADGSLRDIDGTPGASFIGTVPGNYYIIVRHRNHLAVMSASQIAIPNGAAYDFTISATQATGSGQLKELNPGIFGLFAGDMNADGVLSVADFNFYLLSSGVNVYNDADLNLDKQITVGDFNLYQPNASVIGIQQIRY
ncbi:MAG: hypothetical protein IPM47_07715 [Sphingobacteriales bacterium]|nr:MAG: hypothetical protein IPM47_07715 [Sphingobacteriales bacterium]